jgi:hypothetical protein
MRNPDVNKTFMIVNPTAVFHIPSVGWFSNATDNAIRHQNDRNSGKPERHSGIINSLDIGLVRIQIK